MTQTQTVVLIAANESDINTEIASKNAAGWSLATLIERPSATHVWLVFTKIEFTAP